MCLTTKQILFPIWVNHNTFYHDGPITVLEPFVVLVCWKALGYAREKISNENGEEKRWVAGAR